MNLQTSTAEIVDFSELGLPQVVQDYLRSKNISTPTATQKNAIPAVQTGQDTIVVGPTGSGKTLAYLIPVLIKLLSNPQERALILTPTREVAEQVHRVISAILGDSKLKYCLIVAGFPIKPQTSQLSKKPQLIVATPGRLNEHLRNNKLLLQNVKYFILDEADRMLELGFVSQIDEIKKTMRGEIQSLLFSVELAKNLQAMAQKFLRENVLLVKTHSEAKPVETLKQKIIYLKSGMKNDTLVSELQKVNCASIVFVASQESAEVVGQHLQQNGIKCEAIHAGFQAGQRAQILSRFREGKFAVLIATDLLARGVDIEAVDCVINYDLPPDAENFIHRLGRTARAGRKGSALTFVTARDKEVLSQFEPYFAGAEEIRLD